MHLFTGLLLLLLCPLLVAAQTSRVGIGITQPLTSLDINGAITSRQMIISVSGNRADIPANTSVVRLTGNSAAAINIHVPDAENPGQRLLIINTTNSGYGAVLNGTTIANGSAHEFIFTNGAYRPIDNGVRTVSKWHTDGNVGTNPAIHFLGTTDSTDLLVRADRREGMRVDAIGNIGIGTTAPGSRLSVDGAVHTTAGITGQTIAAWKNIVIDSSLTTSAAGAYTAGIRFGAIASGTRIVPCELYSIWLNNLSFCTSGGWEDMIVTANRDLVIAGGNIPFGGLLFYRSNVARISVNGKIYVEGTTKANNRVTAGKITTSGKVRQRVYSFPINNIAGFSSKSVSYEFPSGSILMLSIEIVGGNSIHFIPVYDIIGSRAGNDIYSLRVYNKSTQSGSVVLNCIPVN